MINPVIRKAPTDKAVIDNILDDGPAKDFRLSRIRRSTENSGGIAFSLADIGIVSNLMIYQYIGFKIDRAALSEAREICRGVADNAASARRWTTKSRSSPIWGWIGVFWISPSPSLRGSKRRSNRAYSL